MWAVSGVCCDAGWIVPDSARVRECQPSPGHGAFGEEGRMGLDEALLAVAADANGVDACLGLPWAGVWVWLPGGERCGLAITLRERRLPGRERSARGRWSRGIGVAACPRPGRARAIRQAGSQPGFRRPSGDSPARSRSMGRGERRSCATAPLPGQAAGVGWPVQFRRSPARAGGEHCRARAGAAPGESPAERRRHSAAIGPDRGHRDGASQPDAGGSACLVFPRERSGAGWAERAFGRGAHSTTGSACCAAAASNSRSGSWPASARGPTSTRSIA